MVDVTSTPELLPLDAAVGIALRLASSRFPGLPDSTFRNFVSLLTYMAGDSRELSVESLQGALSNLVLAVRDGDASYLTQPRGLRVSRIVDVQEFVESKFYMGQRGYVRPRVMEKLWEFFHGEDAEGRLEAVLAGGIGWGKSFFGEMGMGYMLYKLSCYHSPQVEYGLAPGSSIFFVMQSVKLELAQKVLFGQLGQRLRRSEYFSKYFPFDQRVRSELRFPHDVTILPLSSSDTAALGLNVFGGILDELNFMSRVLRPSSSRFTGEQEYDQAAQLYATIVRRIKSRFSVRGRVPGKLFLISSANYPGDFIDRKIAESEAEIASTGRSSVFVVRMAQWESLPEDRLSPERFLVEVGDATRSSRLIASIEEAVEPSSVIEVPADYRSDFERDLEAALRDLAGIPIGGSGAFIKRRESIERAAVLHTGLFGGEQLFRFSAVDLTPHENALGELLNERYFEFLVQEKLGFCIHVDLSLTGDSCGLAVGHFGGLKHVGKSVNWSEEEGKYVEEEAGQQPAVIIDGVLEVLPPRTDEIDINLVGDLLELLNARLNLEVVTADSFQSASMLQRMRRLRNRSGRRIRAGMLSVDANLAPYCEVKQALRDERLLIPNMDKLKKELRDLILDPKSKKVDHPAPGSKDISDAVAGVTYVVIRRNSQRGIKGTASRSLLGGIDVVDEATTVRPKGSGRRFY